MSGMKRVLLPEISSQSGKMSYFLQNLSIRVSLAAEAVKLAKVGEKSVLNC